VNDIEGIEVVGLEWKALERRMRSEVKHTVSPILVTNSFISAIAFSFRRMPVALMAASVAALLWRVLREFTAS
jgi:hypothetical protein